MFRDHEGGRVKCAVAGDLKDRDIRAALVSHLRRSDRSAVILHEVPLSRGDRRADVISVNGSLEGYEIKSDKDSLARLSAQAREYEKVCEYLTVVVARRHLEEAIDQVGTHWGVVLAEPERGRVTFTVVREPRRNHFLDSRTLVRMLWKPECLRALRSLGVNTSKDVPVIDLWDRLSTLEPQDVCAYVRASLKARQSAPIHLTRM